MTIRYFDMFAGIGGFRSGLEAIGGFECVGYCEIDKYAKQAYEAMYDTGGELYFDDARKIVPEQLPDFDLITGGFPCQSFSIAGARKGFDDIRGTLFLKLLELLPLKNLSISSSKMFPVCLTMTQAKHLKQSSVRGPPKSCKLFGERRHSIACEFLTACGWKRVSRACTDEGYDVCWQVLNSKISEYPNHEIECTLSDIIEENVPEKYYLSRKQAEKLLYKEKPTQGERIYSSKGLSCTLTSGLGGFGGHSGLYLIEDTENFGLPIKSKTKDGYQMAYPGDSIDTAFSGQNSRRGRVGSQIAHTLTTSATQAYYFIDLNPNPKLTEIARCITARQTWESVTARLNIREFL